MLWFAGRHLCGTMEGLERALSFVLWFAGRHLCGTISGLNTPRNVWLWFAGRHLCGTMKTSKVIVLHGCGLRAGICVVQSLHKASHSASMLWFAGRHLCGTIMVKIKSVLSGLWFAGRHLCGTIPYPNLLCFLLMCPNNSKKTELFGRFFRCPAYFSMKNLHAFELLIRYP